MEIKPDSLINAITGVLGYISVIDRACLLNSVESHLDMFFDFSTIVLL